MVAATLIAAFCAHSRRFKTTLSPLFQPAPRHRWSRCPPFDKIGAGIAILILKPTQNCQILALPYRKTKVVELLGSCILAPSLRKASLASFGSRQGQVSVHCDIDPARGIGFPVPRAFTPFVCSAPWRLCACDPLCAAPLSMPIKRHESQASICINSAHKPVQFRDGPRIALAPGHNSA